MVFSLFHMEWQAGPDASVPQRTHLYSAALYNRHKLEVRSVVVLLRREANLSTLTGVYERRFAGHEPYVRFHYQVIRVWELPTAQLLAGGPGTLPLAPISNVTRLELPGVIERMKERLRARHLRKHAPKLWAATYVLLGLNHPQPFIDQLLKGVEDMEESSTYQAILAKGAAREARTMLLLQGQDRFGAPDEAVRAALEGIEELGRLEELGRRLLHVASWKELLESGQQQHPARGRKKKS